MPSPRPTPAGQTTVHVPCHDALGRKQKLAIIVRDGSITIQTPPGEVAILDIDGITHLIASVQNSGAVATKADDKARPDPDHRRTRDRIEAGDSTASSAVPAPP